MPGDLRPRQVAEIALFAFILGTAGFFNTFDLSSGKIVHAQAVPNVPYYFFNAQGNPSITVSGAQGTGQSAPLDFAGKASGATVSNQAIHKGTVYCTGLTSAAWSPVQSGDTVLSIAQMVILNVNVTTSYWTVVLYIGGNGNIPSTSFGTGNCANLTGATQCVNNLAVQVANVSSVFPQDCISTRASGTYYAWVQITLINSAINPSDVKATFSLGAPSAIVLLQDQSFSKVIPSGSSPVATTNQGAWVYPSATTELFGQTNERIPMRLQSPISQIRFFATVVTPAVYGFSQDTTARMWVQYSSDSGVTWHDVCGDSSQNPNVDVTVSTNNPQTSSYCIIQQGAFTASDILLRVVGDGGDDFTTAVFNGIAVEFA